MPITLSMEDGATLELGGMTEYIGSAYAPQVNVTQTATGHEVTITYDDATEGIIEKTFPVEDGDDYNLTQEDRQQIAGIVEGDLDQYISDMERVTEQAEDAERGRSVAESERVTAERGRQSAETGRESAEGTRTQAEAQRAENELQRTSSEASRASAESARATAESARASAEATRASEWATISSGATAATSAANTAAAAAAAAEASISAAAARGDFDGYSPTVAITDGESSHTVTITDKQGPHSYTVPTYVAEEAARAEEWADLKADAEAATEAAQEAATEVAPEVAWLWGNQLTGELTGDLLTASDAYAAPPMSLTVDGRSTQDGTPTPDAPVPIESVDELALVMAGRNLLPNNATSQTINGITFTVNQDGSITTNGTASATAQIWLIPTAAKMDIPRGTYRLNGGPASSASLYVDVLRYAPNESAYTELRASAAAGIPIDIPEDGYQLAALARVTSGTTVNNATLYPQLEAGSTATAYEPYRATTVPIPLQGHVLRSLPDGTKDTMTLTYLRPSTREGWAWYTPSFTKHVEQYLFSDFSWLRGSRNYDDTGYVYRSTTYRSSTAIVDGALSTAAAFVAHAAVNWAWELLPVNTIGMYVSSSNGGIPIFCADYANASDLVAAIGNETLLLPLATPTTETLDPVELPVLPAPTCTVWADPTTGLQMEYVRDSNLVVQSLSAETAIAYASIATVDGPTATASHAVGTYLTMGGTLYKVTSAIAVGETIAAGTNVTATTVMAELIARTA